MPSSIQARRAGNSGNKARLWQTNTNLHQILHKHSKVLLKSSQPAGKSKRECGKSLRSNVCPKTCVMGLKVLALYFRQVYFFTHRHRISPSSWAPSVTFSLRKVIRQAEKCCCLYSCCISRVFSQSVCFPCRSGETHLAAIFHHHWTHEPRGGEWDWKLSGQRQRDTSHHTTFTMVTKVNPITP